MAESFRAALLLSMPQLQDPNFARTVVLLCDYGAEGAFGLVLNRPTDIAANDMVSLDPPVVGGNDMPLWVGGPVEPQRGWILLGAEPNADFKLIREGLYLSTSVTLLREVLGARPAARARGPTRDPGGAPGARFFASVSGSFWIDAVISAAARWPAFCASQKIASPRTRALWSWRAKRINSGIAWSSALCDRPNIALLRTSSLGSSRAIFFSASKPRRPRAFPSQNVTFLRTNSGSPCDDPIRSSAASAAASLCIAIAAIAASVRLSDRTSLFVTNVASRFTESGPLTGSTQ